MDKPCCICQKADGRYRLSQNLEATMCYDGPKYSLWVCGDRLSPWGSDGCWP